MTNFYRMFILKELERKINMSENEKNTIKIFENQNIKDVWDSEKEDYYFSIIDIIKALTGDETINETFDPSKAINRGITQYKSQEYNDTWIEKRLKGILYEFEL